MYLHERHTLNRDQEYIWEIYIHSWISDKNKIWAGKSTSPLPLPIPIHIITAWNPLSETYSVNENTYRNKLLLADLQQRGNLEILPVIGHSQDKQWQEESFAVFGLTREQACKIASHYNQRAIFELTDEDLLVIDTNIHEIKRRRPRKFED